MFTPQDEHGPIAQAMAEFPFTWWLTRLTGKGNDGYWYRKFLFNFINGRIGQTGDDPIASNVVSLLRQLNNHVDKDSFQSGPWREQLHRSLLHLEPEELTRWLKGSVAPVEWEELKRKHNLEHPDDDVDDDGLPRGMEIKEERQGYTFSEDFRQVFFKPGQYLFQGEFHTFTQSDLAEIAANTNAMLDAGMHVPVLDAHVSTHDEVNGPLRDRKSALNVVGWLKRIHIEPDGDLAHTLEITDGAASEKINNKSVKFTSPEVQYNYTDTRGRRWGNVSRGVQADRRPCFVAGQRIREGGRYCQDLRQRGRRAGQHAERGRRWR